MYISTKKNYSNAQLINHTILKYPISIFTLFMTKKAVAVASES